MQTPLDVPLIQFGRQVRRPRRWYHTCSGEHAAVLRGCKLKGWERVGYTLPSHPMFDDYVEVLRKYLGDDWNPIRVARDGCGLPTVSNTVGELAQLLSGLAMDQDEDWIWEAMVKKPDLVGGFNRLDSTIIKAGKGKVIAKEGADGLLGMAIIHPDYPKGLGVAVKSPTDGTPRQLGTSPVQCLVFWASSYVILTLFTDRRRLSYRMSYQNLWSLSLMRSQLGMNGIRIATVSWTRF